MKKYYRNYCTHFLFAQPSFLSGLARTLDLHGQFDSYNVSRTGEEADLRARLCDWLLIQQDLDVAWGRVLQQNPEYLKQLVEAISHDPNLLRGIIKRKETKSNELQMATAGT